MKANTFLNIIAFILALGAGCALSFQWIETLTLEKWVEILPNGRNSILIFSALLLTLASAVVWKRKPGEFLLITTRFLCYCLGSIIIIYGLAKIFKTQFFFSLATADTPVRELPNTVLTWYYFGQSYPFTLVIAFTQILGGMLLFFRRTELLGSLILLPVLVNICALNFFYELWPVTRIVSALYLSIILFIIACNYKRLLPILGLPYHHQPPPVTRKTSYRKFIVIAILTIYPGWSLFKAHSRIDRNTPLVGSYKIVDCKVGSREVDIMHLENDYWRKIYFEKGNWGSVKVMNDQTERMKYLSGKNSSLEISFPEAGYYNFKGSYKIEGKFLIMKGTINSTPAEYTFEKFQ